jgi:hypothetical protein
VTWSSEHHYLASARSHLRRCALQQTLARVLAITRVLVRRTETHLYNQTVPTLILSVRSCLCGWECGAWWLIASYVRWMLYLAHSIQRAFHLHLAIRPARASLAGRPPSRNAHTSPLRPLQIYIRPHGVVARPMFSFSETTSPSLYIPYIVCMRRCDLAPIR